MINSPTFKLLDLPSLRRCSPWDLRGMARSLGFFSLQQQADFEMGKELSALADFKEEQLFSSGAKLKEQLESQLKKAA